jgi:hypothetical protein
MMILFSESGNSTPAMPLQCAETKFVNHGGHRGTQGTTRCWRDRGFKDTMLAAASPLNPHAISHLAEIVKKSCSYSGAMLYILGLRLIFKLASQYPVSPLNPARDLPAEESLKVSAPHQRKGTLQHHGNRNSEVV